MESVFIFIFGFGLGLAGGIYLSPILAAYDKQEDTQEHDS